jgi:metal-dependent hydrolase (beta-lactamase superfamily II)
MPPLSRLGLTKKIFLAHEHKDHENGLAISVQQVAEKKTRKKTRTKVHFKQSPSNRTQTQPVPSLVLHRFINETNKTKFHDDWLSE